MLKEMHLAATGNRDTDTIIRYDNDIDDNNAMDESSSAEE